MYYSGGFLLLCYFLSTIPFMVSSSNSLYPRLIIKGMVEGIITEDDHNYNTQARLYEIKNIIHTDK